ncbi:MAG: amino acid adenylation domain-containing protein [Verrucomicrobiia bacterium]
MTSPDLSQLTLEQRALLERRLLARARGATPAPVAKPGSLLPLSWLQESLWFLQQLLPDSPLYNIPQAFLLRGRLELAPLQRAFGALAERHEALRTRFVTVDGTPLQQAGNEPLRVEVTDLAPLQAAERQTQRRRILDEEPKRPFDLAHDLPVRVRLIRLSEDEHVLTVTAHHIVSDWVSLAILQEELGLLYTAFLTGETPRLADVPLQFPEWAARQREFGDRAVRDGCSAYWRDRLSGAPPGLALPTDRPRPTHRLFRGSSRRLQLPSGLSGELKRLAGQEGVTLYNLLLTAWQTLLFRYSGQSDIIVGSPLTLRGDPECERMVGCLLNTVLLRTDLSGNPSFRGLLRHVREVTLAAFANQPMPFEKLDEVLQLPGGSQPGVHPFCPVMFQYLPLPPPAPKLQGLETELLQVHTATAKFDLALTLMESREGLAGDLEFDTELFDAQTIDRLAANFEVLLRNVVANPETPIEILSILTETERDIVVKTWNNTATEFPRDASVHELFQLQAAANPDAIALASGGDTLTYGALNEQANQLARLLVRHGVVPGARVGVCLERPFRSIISLLAILKTGAAYVPLDPQYPRDRLESMLRDADVCLVLTATETANALPAGAKRILLDAEPAALRNEPALNLPRPSSAEDVAYIMYTSGSTGQPKGVAVRHRGIVRLVKGAQYASFDASEVFLHFAPLCFDASTFEIWGPLLNGARLAVYPPEFESLEQFESILAREGVTTLWLTAGLFHEMVEHHLSGLKGIRQLLAGGDVLSVPHVLKFLQRFPDCQLINGYGPTENTTFTCCYRFPPDWPGVSSAPIGRAISNSQVYILDRHMAPVPVGVAGELCIGGDGLAQGYVNGPELNEARFVPDAFNPGAGSKLYRTGDQARFLPDGAIEFLGRTDDQVKMNGFRIHLGEVEAALRQVPGVRDVVVLAEAASHGSKHLLAWVVLNERLSADALRESAAARMPSFMVPAVFIPIDGLPLTPNGKIDRQRLPRPTQAAAHSAPGALAPVSAVQERLLQIWQAVFDRNDLTVADNFFTLGGHSLLATRVVSRINAAFGCHLSVSALFEAPSIPALEKKLAQTQREPVSGPIPRRARPGGPAKGGLPCLLPGRFDKLHRFK